LWQRSSNPSLATLNIVAAIEYSLVLTHEDAYMCPAFLNLDAVKYRGAYVRIVTWLELCAHGLLPARWHCLVFLRLSDCRRNINLLQVLR